MNRTLRTLLIGGALAAFAVPAVGFAFDGPSGPSTLEQGELPPRLMQKLERMSDKLDLSAQQQASIKAIFVDSHSAMVGSKQQMRATMKSLDEAITNGADNDTIAELTIDAHSMRSDMRDARQDAKQQVKAILTPEQVQIVKQMRAERKSRRGGPAGQGSGERSGKRDGGFGGSL
ncbi:MAG: Spy/CpxP family protein refolding chaperone [Kiritimatiellia bacterium]|jgi:Spy/CpxP family protein refolding chaperone